MASQQERAELDSKAKQGKTVVPGGTGGKSLEGQERLAEGRSRGGQMRNEQLGTEGYQQMGRKDGLSTGDGGGGERAERKESRLTSLSLGLELNERVNPYAPLRTLS